MVVLPPHAELVAWLAERLRRPLPGLAAHVRMAPLSGEEDPEVLNPEGKRARPAAVLVLLYPIREGGESALVLTLRQPSLRDHSGQVSFPGGGLEPGETPEEAALRESWEEVGVDPEAPRLLGRLSPLYIPPSGFAVDPVVAALAERPAFEPHEAEVAAILEASLARLLEASARRTAVRTLRGQTFEVPYFDLDGFEVWGATAMMLAELLALLEERV